MNPAMSVVIFTTVAGAAQGLVAALAIAVLAGLGVSADFVGHALMLAEVLLLIGLGASFAHLGHPERAWRAVLMWRSSWLSREVIVLPAFIGVVGLWWMSLRAGRDSQLLPVLAVALASLLWYCTAMIYACLRFIEEWAQPLTRLNFPLIGLSSGLVLCCAMAGLQGESALLRASGPAALLATLLAGACRAMSLRHNARLKHRSTLQSATGIRAERLVQTSMGMSAGAFNTREFFHGRTRAVLKRCKILLMVFGFALPASAALGGLVSGADWLWLVALALQAPGLLLERWFFFAQARHPQNLYYQVVS